MIINRISTILFIWFFSSCPWMSVYSSNQNVPIGGRSAAMGNATVCLSDFWSVHNNQAGLASQQYIAGGFYFENRFMVKEMSLQTAAVILPTRSGVFGMNLSYFGYTQYNEKKIGLAYGRSFSDKFSAGIQLDYLSTSLGDQYGSRHLVTFELGIQSKLTDELTIGAHIFNPTRVKLTDDKNERVPTIFKLGMAYSFTDDLLITLETEKDLDYKPAVRGGLEYTIINEAIVRLGYSTIPSTSGSENFSISSIYTFGFGLELNNFNIDFASSVHQTLGWSPQISIVYVFD